MFQLLLFHKYINFGGIEMDRLMFFSKKINSPILVGDVGTIEAMGWIDSSPAWSNDTDTWLNQGWTDGSAWINEWIDGSSWSDGK